MSTKNYYCSSHQHYIGEEMSTLDLIHRAMNPYQYQMAKDYEHLKMLEREAEKSRHIPNSLDVETFDRAECGFISDYFNGSQDAYNEWRSNYD